LKSKGKSEDGGYSETPDNQNKKVLIGSLGGMIKATYCSTLKGSSYYNSSGKKKRKSAHASHVKGGNEEMERRKGSWIHQGVK